MGFNSGFKGLIKWILKKHYLGYGLDSSGSGWLLRLIILNTAMNLQPVPVAARSKAWVCGRSPAEFVGSNTTGGMDV